MSSHKYATIGRFAVVIFTIALAWPILRPLIVQSLVQRANLYLVFGKIPQAERYLARASRIDPNDGDLLDTIAQANVGDKVSELRAIRDKLYSQAKLQPSNGALWLNIAIMDSRLHHFREAAQEMHVATLTLHDPTTLKLQDVLDHHR